MNTGYLVLALGVAVAITILAVSCLSDIDVTTARHGIPEAAGVVVTAAVLLWRRNAVLSILTGTTTCLVLTNLPWRTCSEQDR